MEILLDYMAYLNPEIHLDRRDMWIDGIKLMPENHRLDKGFLYFSPPDPMVLPAGHPPVVYVCPFDCKEEIPTDNSIVLHTDMHLNAVFNELLGTQNLVRSWVHEVEISISRREGVQRLMDISGRVFGNPIAVMTGAFKTIAATWDFETSDSIFWELLELGYLTNDSYRKLKEYGYLSPEILDGKTHVFQPDALNSHTSTITAINQDGATGFIILMSCSNTPISPGIIQLYDYFIEKLRDYLQPATSSNDYLRSQFDNFLIDIIEGHISSQRDIVERSLVYPPAFQENYFSVIVGHESSTTLYLEHAMQNLSTLFPNVRMLQHNKNILMYPKNSSKPEKNAAFFETLNEYLQVNRAHVGVSESFHGLENLRQAYIQARDSLEIGRRLSVSSCVGDMLSPDSGPRRIFRFSDYHVYMLLSGQQHELGILDQLHRYDIDHKTDYYRILFIFLSFDRQFTKTAALLHMHRNNVIYHIGRICEIFSLDLEDPGQRLRLLLLYRLSDLISAGEL
ncbi:MAG: PucR family transcriptional regulator [Candidatus Heteroscillospira sp.]